MKLFHSLEWMAVGLSCVGILLPSSEVVASELAKQVPVQKLEKRLAIADVALTDGGTFCGRVIDRTGKTRGGIPITLKGSQTNPIQATTDDSGRFTINSTSGGIYRVRAERGECLVRLWSGKTAPPNARKSLILVAPGPVVRGQNVAELDTDWDGRFDRYLNLTEAVVLVASVTAIAVAGVTINKRNRLADNIEKLPFTP
jgi:hypothetical protein